MIADHISWLTKPDFCKKNDVPNLGPTGLNEVQNEVFHLFLSLHTKIEPETRVGGGGGGGGIGLPFSQVWFIWFLRDFFNYSYHKKTNFPDSPFPHWNLSEWNIFHNLTNVNLSFRKKLQDNYLSCFYEDCKNNLSTICRFVDLTLLKNLI